MLVLNNLIEFLKQEGVSAQLVEEVRHYSEEHTVDEALKKRIPVPHFHYYGNKVWEEALAVLLCGRNLLLAGEKATGKNVLAQNLAAVFERPAWDISFHVNMDAAALIGSDTFHDGRVTFRPGPVYCCAQSGGFGILDEINMARNEALAVLHSVLDFRRVIDVPGYDKEDIKIELQDGYLTVSAEKNEEKEDKHAKYLKRERFTGMCSRSYYVGDNLKEEDIKANFKNGILTIEFPKEVEKKVEEKKYIPIGE